MSDKPITLEEWDAAKKSLQEDPTPEYAQYLADQELTGPDSIFHAVLEDCISKHQMYDQSGEEADKIEAESCEEQLKAMYRAAVRGQVK